MGRKKNYAQRDHIMKMSYKLFTQNGYDDITTRQIAKECGMERALLHHYFNKKEDIIIKILVTLTAEMYTFLIAHDEISKHQPDIMGLSYSLFLNMLEKKPGLKSIYLTLLRNTTLLMEAIYTALEPETEALPFLHDRDEEIAFIITNGCISQLLVHSAVGEINIDSNEIINTVIRMHYLYLGRSEEDIKLLQKRVSSIISEKMIQDFIAFFEKKHDWVSFKP